MSLELFLSTVDEVVREVNPGTAVGQGVIATLISILSGVLVWFMYKVFPAVVETAKDNAKATDRVGRILVSLTLSIAQLISHNEVLLEQCENYKKELDDAEAKRTK